MKRSQEKKESTYLHAWRALTSGLAHAALARCHRTDSWKDTCWVQSLGLTSCILFAPLLWRVFSHRAVGMGHSHSTK